MLSGDLRFAANDSLGSDAGWINEISITVLGRVNDESDWVVLASPVECGLDFDLPLEVTLDSIDDGKADVEFACYLTQAVVEGSEVRVRVEAVDDLWLDLKPRDQSGKI